MSDPKKPTPKKRQYPPFFEKFVPIALGIIIVFILALLVITVCVALGVFPSAG